jgi:hypothetical protein
MGATRGATHAVGADLAAVSFLVPFKRRVPFEVFSSLTDSYY